MIIAWPAAFVAAAMAAAIAFVLVVSSMSKGNILHSQASFIRRARADLKKPGVSLVLLSSAGNSCEALNFGLGGSLS